MNPPNRSLFGYGLLLVLLLLAYRGAAVVYRPHVPSPLNLADRQSRLGTFLFDVDHVEQGLELCQNSATKYPDSPQAHYYLALVYDHQNRRLEALSEYREATRHDPQWVLPRVNLGILLGQMGRLEEALEEFSKAGDDPHARHNLEITRRAIEARKRQVPPG